MVGCLVLSDRYTISDREAFCRVSSFSSPMTFVSVASKQSELNGSIFQHLVSLTDCFTQSGAC